MEPATCCPENPFKPKCINESPCKAIPSKTVRGTKQHSPEKKSNPLLASRSKTAKKAIEGSYPDIQVRTRAVVGWSWLAASHFRGGDPALQALEFVRNYGHFSDTQKDILIHSFPITTLERLLSTREVRKLIGVEIIENKLSTELPADEIIKPLRRMVLDLVENKFNVTKLKNKSAQTEYVQNFDILDRPDFSKKGTLIPIENIREADFRKKPGAVRQSKRRLSDPSDRKTVIPSKLRLNVLDQGGDDIQRAQRT